MLGSDDEDEDCRLPDWYSSPAQPLGGTVVRRFDPCPAPEPGPPEPLPPRRRLTLEEARLARAPSNAAASDRIAQQMQELAALKRQAEVQQQPGRPPEEEEEEEERSLRVQADTLRRRVDAGEQRLVALRAELDAEEARAAAVQEELRVAECDAEARVQAEMRLRMQAEMRREELQTALTMMPQARGGESEVQAVRERMLEKLSAVRGQMQAQFQEEREKLEGRVEFLTKLNSRKDAEIESLHNKRGEINNMLDQVKAAHRTALSGYQGRYEHENKQVLQLEGTVSKLQREVKMKAEECEKLRERLVKAGGNTRVRRDGSPSASRRKPQTGTPGFR